MGKTENYVEDNVKCDPKEYDRIRTKIAEKGHFSLTKSEEAFWKKCGD